MTISALGDQPLSTVARWVSSPGERGTYNILSDCILTLVLCVWTSVHLNIPKTSHHESRKRDASQSDGGEGESGGSFPWKKFKYVILSLIMPEVVAAVAFNQWLEHRSLMKFIKNETDLGAQHTREEEDPRRVSDEETGGVPEQVPHTEPVNPLDGKGHTEKSIIQDSSIDNTDRQVADDDRTPSTQSPKRQPPQRATPWTALHGWYAVMGGFTISKSSSAYPRSFLFPNGRSSFTLTSDAVKLLAKHHPHVFPPITASEIADKSKSSELAKLIVCTQITWFIINTIGRVGQGLPLTVLELNTAAHCICTFVTYAFWWHKPLDVVQPSAVDLTEEAAGLAAQMYVRSLQRGWLLREDELRLQTTRGQRFKGWLNNHIAPARDLEIGPILVVSPEDIQTFKILVTEGEVTRPSRWLMFHFRKAGEAAEAQILSTDKNNQALRPSEIKRAKREANGNARLRIVDFDGVLQMMRLADGHAIANPDLTWSHSPFCITWFTRANPNHPYSNVRAIALGTSGLSFVSACTLYALVHSFAWNGPFRSEPELYLWRMGVLAFVPLMLVTPTIALAVWRRGESYLNFVEWVGKALREALERRGRSLMRVLGRPSDELGSASYLMLVSLPFYLLQGPIFIFKILVSRFTILIYFIFAVLGFLTGRAFLVVEAFLSLPYAPDGAFVLPNWMAYLPHFG